MALFRGTLVYLRSTARDVTFGTDVRALLSTAAADTNFTITYTSTTAATQTVDPYTNISNVTADNRTNLGWAFNQNEASTDGVGSISTRKRIIPSGTWSFSNSIAGSAPALLANYDVTLEYSIYRVAANGGARSLLFSFSGTAINRTAAGTFTATATSPSQPVYTLEPNETIHLAIRITSAATSSLLGGTTNTVLTINGATSGSQSMTLPSPGMRDLYFDTNTAIGEGAGTESILTRKDIYTAIGEGDGVINRKVDFFRTLLGVGEGISDRELLTVMKFAAAIGEGAATRSNFVRKDLISAVGEGVATRSNLVRKDNISAVGEGSGTYSRLWEAFREFDGVGEGVGTRTLKVQDTFNSIGEGDGLFSRRQELFRTFNGVGEGDGLESILVRKDTFLGVGESLADLMRAVVFVRDFLAEGEGVGDITKSVIFVRDFVAVGKATIRPRIALDWDDLPDAGGGSVITNVYRPVFLFED